ncbi:MAG: TonB-dependent receptor domain-containing protein [Bacteroidota bacterium]
MTNRIRLLSFVFLLLLPLAMQAQDVEYTITGTLIDERTEDPLTGANISVEGTTIGTSADVDGNFEFTANLEPGTYNLRISFVGYRTINQEVELGNEQDVDLGTIALDQDIIGQEEIVVTGASALTEKRQLGNTISTVSADELEASGALSVDRALSGKISGATIQQNSGNPAGGMSVRLRGTGTLLGSADPLYIIDGVIVNNDSPELLSLGGYSQNRMVDINPNDIERIEVVKGAAAAALYGSRANNGVVQIFTKKGESGEPKITYSTKFNRDNVRETLKVNESPVDAAGNEVERFDHQDYIFRTAYGTEQNLSISGGTESTRYYASGGFYSNQGVTEGSKYNRANGRLNLDQELNDWASLTFNTTYTYSDTDEVPNGGLNDNYGVLTGFIFGPNTYDPRPDPETNEYPTDGILVNPVEAIDKYEVKQNVSRVLTNASLNLVPTDKISIDYTLGLDSYSQNSTFYIPVGTTAPGLGQGFSRRGERTNLQLNNDLNLRYATNLSADLESTTLIGGTMQYEDVETVGIQARELSPFVETVSGGADYDAPGESRSELVVYGIFGQETLGWKDKLFATVAGRFDASSSFGADERWQFYPKVSGSYLISEEDFWQNSSLGDYVSSLKFRASLGESGGLTAIGAYDRFTRFSPTSVSGQTALLPSSNRGAINIKPERQRELELGIDASFFEDRMSVEFSWYDQQTTDLLLNRSIAPTTGYSSQLGNFGELTNRGIELLVKAVPVNSRNLQWTTSFNYSRNENEVDGLEEDVLQLPDSFGGFVAAVNGEPLGAFYGAGFERDDDGNIQYDDNDLPIASEAKVIGDANADFTGSFINELQIGKHWNIRAQMDFSYGNEVLNFTRRLAAIPVFGTLHDPYGRELEGDLPEGYSQRVSGIFENWVEDASYLKLRELSVSRTIFTEFAGLESLRLRLSGRNLFSIDSYSGYDPEINTAGQRTAVRGFDFVEVPIPRSVQFSLTANF